MKIFFVIGFYISFLCASMALWASSDLQGSGKSQESAIPIHTFQSPNQELQYKSLLEILRCPKCQNQNIADSDATIAVDIRAKVYELTLAGKTQSEIIDYMVERYGDFVSYRPPIRSNTFLLWLLPILIFIMSIIVFSLRSYQKSRNKSADVSSFDEKAFVDLMNKVKDSSKPS
jgi:cytochrome c-type biogenesis protein CcmH